MATVKATLKVCDYQQKPRSRIWLERSRLTEAGFAHGTRFRKLWKDESLVLEIVPAKEADAGTRADYGTVCGKKDRPIIDIVGAKVREVFGKVDEIEVTFNAEAGRITIKKA